MNNLKFSLKKEIFAILLVITSLVFGFYFYSHFPTRVASHWNFQGLVDGYSGKFTGAFAIPILIFSMYSLFLFLPLLDPKKDRYIEFSNVFTILKNSILTVIFLVYLASGFYNLGYGIKINLVVPSLIGLLMIIIGSYMGKIKSNWFVGIRTPWTLSSENVWNKTHRMGGFAFIIFGIIIIICPLLPKILAVVVFIFGLIFLIFGSFIYSYILYRKEKK